MSDLEEAIVALSKSLEDEKMKSALYEHIIQQLLDLLEKRK